MSLPIEKYFEKRGKTTVNVISSEQGQINDQRIHTSRLMKQFGGKTESG